MKKSLPIFLLSTLSVAFASCGDDKSAPIAPITDKTYDASSGLEMYCNGFPMPGKTIDFKQNGNVAEITAYSEFDLSQLSAFGLSGKIPAPGIIPGSPKISLNTDVVPSDGGWTFAGTSANDFCTYSYSGFATDKMLKFYITDLKLNNPISPVVWTLASIEKNNDGTYKSLPIYVDWQYSPLPDVDIDFKAILQTLTMLPVIPVYNNTAYMSVSEAISEMIRAVAFKSDGNILFTYVNNSFGAARIDQTQPNGYQYVIDSPSSVRLYINPLSFFSLLLNNTSGGTPEADIDLNDHGLFPAKKNADNKASNSRVSILDSEFAKNVIKSFLEMIMPQLAEGIPLSFNVSASGMNIFLDTQMTVTMLNKILLPMLSDEPTIKGLLAYIESDASLKPLLPTIQKALSLIPEIFELTNTLRLGFSLVPSTTSK